MTNKPSGLSVDKPTKWGFKVGDGVNKQERDPNGRDLKEPGTKGDLGKPPLLRGCLQYFPRALIAVSEVSLAGANKYSWRGWETVDDGINRYGDALARHLAAETIEGPIDNDTKCLHATQVCWNSLARLELILREQERPTPPRNPGEWVAVNGKFDRAGKFIRTEQA